MTLGWPKPSANRMCKDLEGHTRHGQISSLVFHWSRKTYAQSEAVSRLRTRRCQSEAGRKQMAHTNEVISGEFSKGAIYRGVGGRRDSSVPRGCNS